MIPFVMTKSGITFYEGSTPHLVSKDHVQFENIREALLSTTATLESLLDLSDLTKSFKKWSKGDLVLEENSKILYQGRRISSTLETRLVDMILEGKPETAIQPFVNFLEKLYQNPSKTAVEELYLFLEACNLPIVPNGNFLAYKKVRDSYKDIHSDSFDNSIGQSPSMPRNAVNENRHETCSDGLHCCSFEYLKNFGHRDDLDRVVIVSVNPKDVVTVPADYDNQKMRVSTYTVVDEIPNDGCTRIMEYLAGDRKEGWIRETIKTLKEILARYVPDVDFSLEEGFRSSFNDAQWNELLNEVSTSFGLKLTKSATESFNYRTSLSGLLQFVSNWTL
jgi:hypothetical protein